MNFLGDTVVAFPGRKPQQIGFTREELTRILDKMASLRMNAVILQVRPQADAVYRSRIEPWSPWLTGTMGRDPGYDPLAYCIQQAHARNIEVHAWFNPFRAHHSQGGPINEASVINSKKNLSAVQLNKDGNWWLDPGNTENQNCQLSDSEHCGIVTISFFKRMKKGNKLKVTT